MVEFEQQRPRTPSNDSSQENVFFIDRDPDLFAAILRYHDTSCHIGDDDALMGIIACTGTKNSAFTTKCLLHEAGYYNIQRLEHEIRTTAHSPTIKYEYCVLQGINIHTFPLAEEASKAFVKSGMIEWQVESLRILTRFMEGKNSPNSDGYKWEICAILSVQVPKVIVVLKGQRIHI
jgi:hypothetical protein